jgi:hypothetical protein
LTGRLICEAILSVYNKTGLLDLAKGLSQNGIRLLASGGTAKLIREAGMEVQYALLLLLLLLLVVCGVLTML